MTLGKSSSADSEGPVPFKAVFPADEECFLTIVNFGFSTANPPGGSLGAPVTN
uniref:E3 ubiquitin-protein ligase UPL3-like n=1 Tax=Rhizophora mucronata TaxID=61149 RepID=A0A2P2MVF5_RHIMU